MTIVLAKEVCQQITVSLEREWLETNGIGGYASSTIAGANTRRYHGLLMAATRPPLGRTLLLTKLEEFLCIEGKEIPLSTNIYPNTIYPEGYKNLVRFYLNPFPAFDYSVNGIRIKKNGIHGSRGKHYGNSLSGTGQERTAARPCFKGAGYDRISRLSLRYS